MISREIKTHQVTAWQAYITADLFDNVELLANIPTDPVQRIIGLRYMSTEQFNTEELSDVGYKSFRL